ncbi:MAG: hypothetical protein V3W52_12570, partial [Syntrophobacteria bacterium]
YPAVQSVQWSIDEPNLSTVTLTLNGVPKAMGLGQVEDTVTLASGLNVIEIAALDQAGNFASSSVQVTLDGDNDGDGEGDYYDLDDDNDLVPDSWEQTYGFDPFDPFDVYLDSDSDGHANLTEYSAGTDPLDPASFPIVTLAVDHITVTDVTPDGFAVIWQATQASTCNLVVYDDTGAPLGNLTIESESELHPPAEDNGVMKVRVSGVDANTTYQFQTVTTSKADDLALVTPSYSQLLAVVTESASATVTNDSIKQEIYDQDGNAADGTLVVASVAGGRNPVTAWVGEGVASPWAQVDLNQIYSELTHENLQLQGDEELTLWSFGGMLGNYINVQKIASPTGTEQAALPQTCSLNTQTGYHVDLAVDLNIIGLAVCSKPDAFTAHSLLLYLEDQVPGDETAVESIRRYHEGSWEMVSWFLGMPAGVDFPIEAGKAYLIYMKRDVVDDVWFEGILQGATIDLAEGLNLVSLPGAEDGFDYTSHEMLQDLGTDQQIYSLRRYTTGNGWEMTSWFMGLPSGAFYSTSKGEGYLVNMKEEKIDWRPY